MGLAEPSVRPLRRVPLRGCKITPQCPIGAGVSHMSATTTSNAPLFRTIQGWTIPLECPPAKTLRSWGRPKLTACAVLHPVAAEVLAEKDAADAAYEAECAE